MRAMWHILKKILIPLAGLAAIMIANDLYGFPGAALVLGGIVMWVLLHFTRMMHVLRRAGNRPIGYCDSAVMLNAKLKPGVNLLHVIAMTRALGEQLSRPNAEPEVYRWTDGTASSVTCEFAHGKLVKWDMVRPPAAPEPAPPADDAAAAVTAAPPVATESTPAPAASTGS